MIFAYRDEFATAPIAAALERRGWAVIASEHPEELLNAGHADIAFAPPLAFANSIGVIDLALVPGVGITLRGFAGLMKLIFRKGLVSFNTLATKEPRGAEAAVAAMLLAEKHDIAPTIVKAEPIATPAEMLAVADSALLVGDDAIFNAAESRSVLDLADEWEDAVESPLPYMVAWGRIGAVPASALEELIAARDEAVLTLADRAARHADPEAANVFYGHYLRGEVEYSLGEAQLSALDAFFRYAFYYSAITDIPAIKLLPDGTPADFPVPGA